MLAEAAQETDSSQASESGSEEEEATDGEGSRCPHVACAGCQVCLVQELELVRTQYGRSGTDQFRRRVSVLILVIMIAAA